MISLSISYIGICYKITFKSQNCNPTDFDRIRPSSHIQLLPQMSCTYPNEEFRQCGKQCERSCETPFMLGVCTNGCGSSGCYCRDGYVRMGHDRSLCIPVDECSLNNRMSGLGTVMPRTEYQLPDSNSQCRFVLLNPLIIESVTSGETLK